MLLGVRFQTDPLPAGLVTSCTLACRRSSSPRRCRILAMTPGCSHFASGFFDIPLGSAPAFARTRQQPSLGTALGTRARNDGETPARSRGQRMIRLKLHAHAEGDIVAVDLEGGTANWIKGERVILFAEVAIAVFTPENQVVGEGVFGAAADGIAY
jgi:hypothetical protein